MTWYRVIPVLLLAALILLPGCLRYSFTGVNIPSDVRTVYIPFFPDQSNSGLANLSDDLNEALVDRFVNQSRLSLTNNEAEADMRLEGRISGYSNEAFSIAEDRRAELNRVTVTVQSEVLFPGSESGSEWNRSFSGTNEYDPQEAGADGEVNAAFAALQDIADDMFNEALGDW